MRCNEYQAWWYLFLRFTKNGESVWSLSAAVAPSRADKRLLGGVAPVRVGRARLFSLLLSGHAVVAHVLFTCVHALSDSAQVKKSDHTDSCACAAHFVNCLHFSFQQFTVQRLVHLQPTHDLDNDRSTRLKEKKARSHMSAHCSGALVPIAELASETKEFGKWCAASWNTRVRRNCLGNSRGITDCAPCVERERVPTNGGIRPETETARGAVDSSTPSDRATTRGTDSGESSAGYRESCKRAHTSNGNKEFS